MKYQDRYSQYPVAEQKMFDVEGRLQKARKVIAVLEDYLGDLSSLTLLDLACSTGIMTRFYSDRFKATAAIDIDTQAVAYAKQFQAHPSVTYYIKDAMKTEFSADSFDVVTCTQVYEHVPSAAILVDEIYRILKPGGVCFFGASNRLKLIEPHYGRLPFLSIIPKPMGHLYLRLLRKADFYYETHLTMWGLRRLVSRFKIIDYTKNIIQDPVRYEATDVMCPNTWRQRCALLVLRYAYGLFPGYIWLLQKPGSETHSSCPGAFVARNSG